MVTTTGLLLLWPHIWLHILLHCMQMWDSKVLVKMTIAVVPLTLQLIFLSQCVCFVKCCFLFTSVNGWRWKSHFFVSLLDGPLSQLLPISLYDFVSGGHYTLKISKPMVNTQQTLRGFQKTKCAREDLYRGKYYA